MEKIFYRKIKRCLISIESQCRGVLQVLVLIMSKQVTKIKLKYLLILTIFVSCKCNLHCIMTAFKTV